MIKTESLQDKSNFLGSELIKIQYIKESKSGRLKKGTIACVSKQNANYLIKHDIAKLI